MSTGSEKLGENWGMIGHDWAVEMLRNQIRQNAVRHAYLITGPAGVGRRSLALRFIQALTCTSPTAPAIPCGTCQTCKQVEAMQFPDLLVIQSEIVGRELKVDQVRSIQYNLSLKPLVGSHRFALFLRFQEANASASNALLKTLEDAPAHATLLLTADSTESLLPTIVSRCEVLRLKQNPIPVVEKALKDLGAGDQQAHLLAHISDGRPGQAIHLLNHTEALDLRGEILDELQFLLSATRIQKFAIAEKLTKDRDKDKVRERLWRMLEIWLAYWRDVFVTAAGSKAALVNVDRTDEVRVLANRLDLATAMKMVTRVEEAIIQMEGNVNLRLLVEVLFLDLPAKT